MIATEEGESSLVNISETTQQMNIVEDSIPATDGQLHPTRAAGTTSSKKTSRHRGKKKSEKSTTSKRRSGTHGKKAPSIRIGHEEQIEHGGSTMSLSLHHLSTAPMAENGSVKKECVENKSVGDANKDSIKNKEKKHRTKGKKGSQRIRSKGSETRMSSFSSSESDISNITSVTIITAEETESDYSTGIERRSMGVERHPSFSTVEVMEFQYALGTGSVSSQGPPVCISSTLVHKQSYDIDRYEGLRSNSRREEEDLVLTAVRRKEILLNAGYTEYEIEDADVESTEIRIQRRKSVTSMDWDGWAARKESVSRKIRKLTNTIALFKRSTKPSSVVVQVH